MSWRVLLTDRAWPDSSVEQRELAAVGAELIEAPDGSEPTLTRLAVNVDAIMTCWAPVTEAAEPSTWSTRRLTTTASTVTTGPASPNVRRTVAVSPRSLT